MQCGKTFKEVITIQMNIMFPLPIVRRGEGGLWLERDARDHASGLELFRPGDGYKNFLFQIIHPFQCIFVFIHFSVCM